MMSTILNGVRVFSTRAVLTTKLPKGSGRSIVTVSQAGHSNDQFHKTPTQKAIHESSSGKDSMTEERDRLIEMGYEGKYLINDEAEKAVILDQEQIQLDAFRNALKTAEKASPKSKK